MIAGLEEISEGELYIGDQLVNDVAPKDRDIAMVFQNYALYPHMTVYDNMAFALKLRKTPKAEIKRRVTEAAKILDIEALLDRKPKALSGGQRQALTLLMASLRTPKLLLLDEHTAALDPSNAAIVMELTRKFAKEYNLTVMMVTHNMQHALDYGSRLLMMDSGEIIMDIGKEEKQKLTMDSIIEKFRAIKKHSLQNDQMLLQ